MSLPMLRWFLVPEPIPALGVCIKVALLLALAWTATTVMRSRAAAARHLVWASALGGALALVALTPVVPPVPVYVPVEFSGGVEPGMAHTAQAPAIAPPALGTHREGISPRDFVLGLEILSTIWVAGALAVGVWLVSGHWALARLVRRARRASLPAADRWLDRALAAERIRRARILVSADVRVPLTWGALRPVILLPAAAASWPADRVRAALRHELAHVARRDCLVQALASFACVTFWFNPLVWLAMNRLRAESERACDDRALGAGLAAPDYAGHLVAVARERWAMPTSLAAAGMARGSDFERRIAAILDDRRPHHGIGARAALGMLVIGAAVLAPLAVLRMRIEPLSATSIRELRHERAASAPAPARANRTAIPERAD